MDRVTESIGSMRKKRMNESLSRNLSFFLIQKKNEL